LLYEHYRIADEAVRLVFSRRFVGFLILSMETEERADPRMARNDQKLNQARR
jgi:hypothetical protein